SGTFVASLDNSERRRASGTTHNAAIRSRASVPPKPSRSRSPQPGAEPEQQVRTGTWSSRGDVPPPAGFKPIFSYQVANDYMSFLTNETELVALRKRFEGY